MNPAAAAPMRTELERFQHAFAAALLDPDARDPLVADLAAQPGFAVYRNTVIKGCIDALQANFPAVARLVGEEWFRAAAAVHVRAEPPRNPVMLDYGAGFARFLETFEPAAELPYLPDVARLDRYWTEAHVAADAEVLVPAKLAALAPDQLRHVTLHLHPAAHWQRFDERPIFTLWQRNRECATDELEIEWRGESALITRPGGAVEARCIDAGACAFLDACASGATLSGAALAALAIDDSIDLTQLMATLLDAGAFSRLQLPESIPEETSS
jgi:hypothetical protein